MGLTIHYSGGKAKNRTTIDGCLEFLKDMAIRLPCKYLLIDETLTGELDDYSRPKSPNNGKRVIVKQKGIMLFLDQGSEPLTFNFDTDSLEFCHYFLCKDGTIFKGGLFCKTQYAKNFMRTHHVACKLLEIVKKKYVTGLRVSDEGEYYGNWNKNKLAKTIEKWNGMIANFGAAMDKLSKKTGLKIEGAGMEIYKDEKLKKLLN